MTEREALKQALAYLEDYKYAEARTIIREVLEPPEHEPVAECVDDGEGGIYYRTLKKSIGFLYQLPPKRKPLTDEQWQVIADTLDCLITRTQKDAIEAVIGIKE